MIASDDPEKAYLEVYAVAGRPRTWKRFDLFKAALDILKDRGLEARDVVWCMRVWSSVGRTQRAE